MLNTVQPKNNARARSGERSSCAARTCNFAARSKNAVFLRFTHKNFRNARSRKSNCKKPQKVENLTARRGKNL